MLVLVNWLYYIVTGRAPLILISDVQSFPIEAESTVATKE